MANMSESEKMSTVIERGFRKVHQVGGTFIVATFFNAATGEVESHCVRDYDYSDCSRDNDYLYNMKIDETARRAWQHHIGLILEGDLVKVVAGRKLPIGTTGYVKSIKPIYNKYGKWVANYVYFENGDRTNVTNCVILEAN